MMQYLKKYIDHYRFAIILSSTSMMFGLLREFIIVGLLGFTAHNDSLQLYLSIFYTIGLTIDAMRLACLNLYETLSLPRILLCASIISMPLSSAIGLSMYFSTNGLNISLLLVTRLGSYMNLIASLLITYKQRNNYFIAAQIINVLPNFILIPGILITYYFVNKNLITTIIYLTSFIPIVQCVLLSLIPNPSVKVTQQNQISIFSGILTFARHFSATTSEQFYQVLIRTAFFNYGAGYLSLFAIAVRTYSAGRFILIDSFIGSKLANWKIKLKHEADYLGKMLNLTMLSLSFVIVTFVISIQTSTRFIYASIQMSVILIIGFYFSTLVRIIYFKINHFQNSPPIVIRFAIIEFMCLLTIFWLTRQVSYPILILVWFGYIAKPFGQLLFLRKHYHGLTLNYGTNSV